MATKIQMTEPKWNCLQAFIEVTMDIIGRTSWRISNTVQPLPVFTSHWRKRKVVRSCYPRAVLSRSHVVATLNSTHRLAGLLKSRLALKDGKNVHVEGKPVRKFNGQPPICTIYMAFHRQLDNYSYCNLYSSNPIISVAVVSLRTNYQRH